MLGYIRVGANDVSASARFYGAILIPLGYVRENEPEGVAFTFPTGTGQAHGPAAIYVGKPYDEETATVGNGSMTAFQAETQETVRRLHAAGLEAGGADEGAPGFRDNYGKHFYVGYLRDPLGNKVAIFCSNPAERARSG